MPEQLGPRTLCHFQELEEAKDVSEAHDPAILSARRFLWHGGQAASRI